MGGVSILFGGEVEISSCWGVNFLGGIVSCMGVVAILVYSYVLGGVFISFWGGGVFYCWRGGPFLGVSASHAPTCTYVHTRIRIYARTESNGHVICYRPVTRSKVNDTVL